MAEIDPDFVDILPPVPAAGEEAIPPDADAPPEKGDDAPPEVEAKPEAPDAVEALLAKLEEEDPEAAAVLFEKLEKEDAPPPPTAPVAVPDEDRIRLETSEINRIAAKIENTDQALQANWHHAWGEYKQAENAYAQYFSRCQEKGEEPDPQVTAAFQQNINAKLIENNNIAKEAAQTRRDFNLIRDIKREIADYPVFAKYPTLYAAMRDRQVIHDNMSIQQRVTVLLEEAKRQGIVAGESKDPKRIDRLRKAVARLKVGKGAGATTATRRAAAQEDKDMKDVPANLRAKFDYALSRL